MSMPKYRRIADDLRARIDRGEFPPGAQLPTRPQLHEEYGAAINTVAQALAVLRADGYVETAQGAGIYALQPGEPKLPPWAEEFRRDMREVKQRLADLEHGPATQVEHQPVVSAIVTSGSAILITKRRDGNPPWAFVGGEIDQGESPADAGVREVKEETGLEVVAGHEIGRRIHPMTGRLCIYMACRVADPARTHVHVGDEAELAEVRWASLAETAALMPSIYSPVLEYLERVTAAP